jgi:hypothetical protein
MIDGADIVSQLMDSLDHLEELTDEFHRESSKRDDAERSYRVALTCEMDILESRGLAATARESYAKGVGSVAELRWKRDRANTDMVATKQAIFMQNRRVDILKDMADREFARPSNR